MKPSRVVLSIFLLGVASMSPKDSAAAGYADLRARAEKFYGEKSFRQAHELYEQAADLSLSPAEKIWVTFELADFAIVVLQPESARLVAGFGRAFALVGDKLDQWLRA